MQQLNEAEINGDENGTRELHKLLQDRHLIPAKLLQFHENYRPPYYGECLSTQDENHENEQAHVCGF